MDEEKMITLETGEGEKVSFYLFKIFTELLEDVDVDLKK